MKQIASSLSELQEQMSSRWEKRPQAKEFLSVFSSQKDEIVKRLAAAIFSRLIHYCEDDALDLIAQSCNLKRVKAEGPDHFRDYLRDPFSRWQKAGTKTVIQLQLERLGYKRTRVVTWTDLILQGVPAPFGGGFENISGADPDGGVSYLAKKYKLRVTHLVKPSAPFALYWNNDGPVVQLAADEKATVLTTAQEVVDAVNQDSSVSPFMGARATGKGTGKAGVGQVDPTIAQWNFFYVEIAAPNGFQKYKLWDDAVDLTYDYVLDKPPAWRFFSTLTTGNLLAFWGTAKNDLWLGGVGGVLFHNDGSKWNSIPSPTISSINAFWGSSFNDIWAVTFNGFFLHYDGISWKTVAAPISGGNLYAIWGSSPNDVWAVGTVFGRVFHYDGTAWSAINPPFVRDWYGIWGTASNNIWAVSYAGSIMHYDGTSWTLLPKLSTHDFYSIWGSAKDDIWVVGTGGTIFHYNGIAWSLVSSPTTKDLRRVFGTAKDNVWAVGSNGTILHYDGTAWSLISSPTTYSLFGIWTSEKEEAWAVGEYGMLIRYATYKDTVPIYRGATGTLWDGGDTWDVKEPYPGAIDEIKQEIQTWKSAWDLCRFLRIQVGAEWLTVPLSEPWEEDVNGNGLDFFSYDF